MKKLFLITVGWFIISITFSQEEKRTSFEIFGQVMSDAGYNFNQMNPDYFDVMRPTQLPSYKNQYGTDGNIFYSARQSMFGFKSTTPTKIGDLKIMFYMDLFGVGADVAQTTFHMLHAYAELGKIGAGHNWSLFSDIGGYPNIIEYWGPVGMSLCKNVQIRFIPIQGKNRLAIALERPGASADQGIYANRIALSDVEPKFDLPDLTSEFRVTRDWGYVEIAGLIRKIEWVDQGNEPFDLSGTAVGWGFNFSTNVNIGKKDMFIGQVIYGEGIQNYMNDAPTDIGIKNQFGNADAPIKGVVLPLTTFSAYLNHNWSEKFSSVIGYSAIYVENSDGQLPSAFRQGNYASTNFLYHPAKNIMVGVEVQWIDRKNYKDDWKTSATRIQLSFRYRFTEIINASLN